MSVETFTITLCHYKHLQLLQGCGNDEGKQRQIHQYIALSKLVKRHMRNVR